jgi:hypothetical protein
MTLKVLSVFWNAVCDFHSQFHIGEQFSGKLGKQLILLAGVFMFFFKLSEEFG